MKTKVKELTKYRLTNGAHYNFMESTVKLATLDSPLDEKIKPELDALKSCVEAENSVLVLTQKSTYTDLIHDGDGLRDDGFRGHSAAVKAFMYLRSGDKKKAAEVLNQHLIDYGRLDPRMSLSKQSGLMTNFIEDLQKLYNTQVELLGLSPFLEMMQEGNEQVKENMALRDKAKGGRSKEAVLDARAATDDAYDTLMQKLEGLNVVDTENSETYTAVINQLNAQIDRYKQQELNQGNSGKEGPDEGDKEPDPEEPDPEEEDKDPDEGDEGEEEGGEDPDEDGDGGTHFEPVG